MKSAKRSLLVPRSAFFLVALLLVLAGAWTNVAQGRSLYLIASITNWGNPLPIVAYNIAPDGSLTFQRQQTIPFRDGGAVGIAIDWKSEFLFITYEFSGDLQVLDARTMADVGRVSASGAEDLAGITFDESRELLYCVDRGTDKLYTYLWNPATGRLTLQGGLPAVLGGSSTYGIALDEEHGLLYTANGNKTVRVYDTATWAPVDTITLDRSAISIAVDPVRNLLYTGAGYLTDFTLLRYNLTTGETNAIQVDPEAGVMGLAVDPATGSVYVTTGRSNLPGGDDLLVFDASLTLIDAIFDIGDPTGIVIPAEDLGYNPLDFRKEIVTKDGLTVAESVYVAAGDTLTYELCFKTASALHDVAIVDTLPEHVTFVDADGDGDSGQYDPNEHTYSWSIPVVSAGSAMCLSLQVKVNEDVPAGTLLRNHATISTGSLPPTTVSADAIVKSDVLEPLGLTKEISGGATDPDESGRRYVDVGQEISYRLCFDNSGNDRPAEAVTIVDVLPSELTFVSAEGDGDFGRYDRDTHTYTWSIGSLDPKETICLELVAQVREDTAPGTRIVNQATIDSDQTEPTSAEAEVTVQPLDFHPLELLKRIADGTIPGADDRTLYVGIGEEVTYEICIDSKDNDQRLDDLLLVDDLPPEVTFVSAEGDGIFGSYDADKHTYTWVYPSLLPRSGVCLSLVVQVRKDTAPGTTITNVVTADSSDITPQTAVVDAVAVVRPLEPVELTKTVDAGPSGRDEDGTIYVEPGQDVTYTLCMANNGPPLSDVTVIDTLPREVTFVSADGDGDFGRYNPIDHTYTWSYPKIESGARICADLTVRVNEDVDHGVTIVNRARLQTADGAAETDAQAEMVVGTPPMTVPTTFSPLILGREGYNRSDQITATLEFPEGIRQSDIGADPLVLNPGNVSANTQTVSIENGRVKVEASFNLFEVLDAIPDNGLTTLYVSGRLESGRAFVGEGTVLVVAVRPY